MMLNKGMKKIGSYQLLQIIGKGANGIVFKGLNNETGRSVAIKQVSLSQQQLKSVQSEIYLLRELSHQHIVKYIDVLQNQDNCLYIVLEYIEGGSLASLVKKYPLPQNLVRVYIKQVLTGLDYLHQMGVVHRDIKGANILLTKEGIVKLADFGVAIRLNEDHKSFSLAGTPYWMAPEIIESKGGISTSCDIWSLGCTVIQLITGNPPYFDLMQYPALFRIVQDDHPPLPQVSEDCKDFLLKCFKKQPDQRLPASKLIRHHWLEQVAEEINEQISQNLVSDVKQLIKRRDYAELSSIIAKLPTKKLIYHNPLFVQLIKDPPSIPRAQFILNIIRDDWQAYRYIASVGLLQSILSGNINNKITLELMHAAATLSLKYADTSLFMVCCLKPFRKFISLSSNLDILIDIVTTILSEESIITSHVAYLFCQERTVNLCMHYLHKNIRNNESIKSLNLMIKISSVQQPKLCQFFKESICYLLKMVDECQNTVLLSKMIKLVLNLVREIPDDMEAQGVIPLLLKIHGKVSINNDNFQLTADIMKACEILSQDASRREQFHLRKGMIWDAGYRRDAQEGNLFKKL